MIDIKPSYSKTRIRQTGERIRQDIHNFFSGGDRNNSILLEDDLLAVENWRASHAHILNTFQATLRGRANDKNITVAQRLKRRVTIYDKLMREPDMNLARMHDIAGCRVIFDNEVELFEFRESLHQARFKHTLKNGENDRYNYIERPKNSGYRGVHDVYQYQGTTPHGAKWNGLLLEIQYRTTYQHSWATAVEVADAIDTTRIKFGDSDEGHLRFFQLASELIARQFENRKSCCPELSNEALIEEFLKIENRIRLLNTFKNLKKSEYEFNFKENAILIFHSSSVDKENETEVLTFKSMLLAIAEYEKLEKQYDNTGVDVVLVRAGSNESMREAFRNYFSDVVDFVQLIDTSCEKLTERC